MQTYAKQGDASAQYNLGIAYLNGDGVPKDSKKAHDYFLEAAKSGFAPAQYNLAVLSSDDRLGLKNDAEALKWMTEAARQGEFNAQKILASWYLSGHLVPKDLKLALTWDFLARRTLELRFEQSAGDPPSPPSIRADGAAEIKKDGKTTTILPDGGVETSNPDGTKTVRYKDGRSTLVQADGVRKTQRPDGFSETEYPDGRKSKRDPKGVVQTTFPDGHTELEADSTDNYGRAVHLIESRDKAGQRTGRRIVRGDTTTIENATRPVSVETFLNDVDGVKMKLTEEITPDLHYGKRVLTRADTGAEPKQGEFWNIERVIESDGKAIKVREVYTVGGMAGQTTLETTPLKMEVVRPVANAGGGDAAPMRTVEIHTATPPSETFRTIQGERIFKVKQDLKPMLQELETLEAASRNFAGVSSQDWQRIKTDTARYRLPLPRPPQKPGVGPSWMTLGQLTSSTLPVVPLSPALDDGSKQVPFGYHGRDVIKLQAWRHAQTPHFIVHYVEDPDARFTMQYIEATYTVLTTLLNLDPARAGDRGHVFLFPNEEAWKQYLAKRDLPPQLGGFAYKNELLLPVMVEKGGREESVKTLCHEATHAILARFYPGLKPPLWFNEGLAEYIAARTIAIKRGHQIEKYFGKADRPMNLERVLTREHYGTTPQALQNAPIAPFYANSERCLRVLCEKLPPEGFPIFVNGLIAGNSPDGALSGAYGAKCPDVAAFEKLVNGE